MRRIAFLWLVLGGTAVAVAGPNPPASTDGASGPALQNDGEIVFAVRKPGRDGHWYANFSYYAADENRKTYQEGGRLCVLDVATGKVRVLLDDPQGGVRDPAVHYDGRTIVFSYRKGGQEHYHLYTIQSDGSKLKQLTRGNFDDIEPCWLPDGGIIFVSSRCNRWVNCWLTQVAIIYRCDADGANVIQLSANIEHDNTPWVLPDGRILYQRWEYVDRSQVHFHHLWTMNPDGTGQMVYYGNLHGGILMIDAKPIPGTDKVLAIFSPGHGRREHEGVVTIIDPGTGPDHKPSAHTVHRDASMRDPYALSENCFLAARRHELLQLDAKGQLKLLHALTPEQAKAGFHLHEPRPLVKRKRETLIAPRIDLDAPTGELVLADIYEGRNMTGIQRGDIKKLLVLETLPKPINYTGGMDPLSYGGTFTLERILGTVPVESDGSAYLKVPAMRPIFFVALDENDLSVKRMHSFVSVMPGEVTGCVGCHEQRTRTVLPTYKLQATGRAPSVIEPIRDVPDVFDYPRDVQPILDRLCVDCHGYDKTKRGGPHAGRLILTGDRGPMFSHSYYMMTIARLFSDGRNRPQGNYPPRRMGSSASAILKMLDGSHYDVKATEREFKMLRLWIESAAAYPGTYAALGTGMIGGYAENHPVHTDWKWPTTQAGAKVIDQRCASCHTKQKHNLLPRSLSDERGVSFWRPSMEDKRLKTSRHIVFNLTRPAKSLILLAPLAEKAGGFGFCKNTDGQPAPVFQSTDDPGYRTLLAMVQAGKNYLDKIKRFDMPGFQPRAAYIREMKRYGILPKNLPPDARLDPYEIDRQYWRSFWHQPASD